MNSTTTLPAIGVSAVCPISTVSAVASGSNGPSDASDGFARLLDEAKPGRADGAARSVRKTDADETTKPASSATLAPGRDPSARPSLRPQLLPSGTSSHSSARGQRASTEAGGSGAASAASVAGGETAIEPSADGLVGDSLTKTTATDAVLPDATAQAAPALSTTPTPVLTGDASILSGAWAAGAPLNATAASLSADAASATADESRGIPSGAASTRQPGLGLGFDAGQASPGAVTAPEDVPRSSDRRAGMPSTATQRQLTTGDAFLRTGQVARPGELALTPAATDGVAETRDGRAGATIGIEAATGSTAPRGAGAARRAGPALAGGSTPGGPGVELDDTLRSNTGARSPEAEPIAEPRHPLRADSAGSSVGTAAAGLPTPLATVATSAMFRASADASLHAGHEIQAASGNSGITASEAAPTPGVLAFAASGYATDYAATLAATRTTDGRIAASPGTAEFAPQLAAQITTFVRDGLQHARLELSPAEMGPLTVQIQLEGNAARVHLAAENAQTRQALEQAMPQLAGSLRESGLTLSGGGVFEQPRQPQPQAQGNGANGDGNADSESRTRGGRAGTGPAIGHESVIGAISAPSARRRTGMVDLVA